MVPRGTKGTGPEFGTEVYLAVWVEHGFAVDGGAADGVVGEGWWSVAGERGDGSVEGADGGDHASCFEAGGWPGVE